MDSCYTCGRDFIKADGSSGKGNEDGKMLDSYLMMTEWYKKWKPDWFKITHPNPYACRRCVKLLIDEGMSAFIGGDPQGLEKFLTTQEWWK